MSDGLSFEQFVALDDCVAIGPVAKDLEVVDILNNLRPANDNDVDIENEDDYPLNTPVPSFHTAISYLETVMNFIRTLPCSEKQSQSVSEPQDFWQSVS